MHEMGITQSIVAIVTEHAAGRRVKKITLEIGKLAAIMPDAIRFCFDAIVPGGSLDGATLDIIEIAGRARCLECGGEVALTEMFGRCACGSARLERLAGEELTIKSMELEIA